jgi:hypothetical protein
MSNDSLPTMNDYYARVELRRHHAANSSASGERIEVFVRIPEKVAKVLAGGQKPSRYIPGVYERIWDLVHRTVPTNPSFAITVVSWVESEVMPPNLPVKPNFRDEDGAEGWVL